MDHPGFFKRSAPQSLSAIATSTGAELAEGHDSERTLADVRPLDAAEPDHLSFFDNRKYLAKLKETTAGACLIAAKDAEHLPAGVTPVLTNTPYHAYAHALMLFYPDAARSLTAGPTRSTSTAPVSPDATIEEGAIIETGATIAAGAVIGSGTRICSGAFIGYRVHIGRNGYIGPNASLIHALVGDDVVIHQGAQIGQDGFGFAMGAAGHLRVPQIGRVIIQDHVDIGANTCIDRGALNDTIIGEGTKIDNLVQIGHNVVTGRHCVIVAQVGISGSTSLGDYVVMGGQSATIGHNHIGTGAQIAAQSGIKSEIPPGGVYGGTPARPIKEFAREVAALKRLARSRKTKG